MENLCDAENIYEEIDYPIINQPFINDAEDEWEDEDDSEEEEDKGDYVDEQGEKVISVSDDDWSPQLMYASYIVKKLCFILL